MTPRVPGYVITGVLGRGATGQVYRATRTRTGVQVALKWVAATGREQRRAAQSEAAMLATLDHPHLIRLHELVPLPDAMVLVLDLADGGSLADLMRRRGRLTPGEAITALAPIGAALAYGHAQGIIHGDLSAGNILFTGIGLPLLGDLGLARILGDDADSLGTPAYIDPGVARGLAPSTSSDVFSLAAVALHVLTGRPIWDGASAAEMLAAAIRGSADDLPERLAGLPDAMRAVLERGLSLSPPLRSTAAGFALDLRHCAAPTSIELHAGRVDNAPIDPQSAAAASPLGPRHASRVGSGSEQLTYGRRVATPPRDLGRRRWTSWRPSRRSVFAAVVALVVVVAAYAAVVGALAVRDRSHVRSVGGGAPRAVATSSRSASAGTARTTAARSSPSTDATTSPSPGAPSITDARFAAAVLSGLDRWRERAYAARDARLLAHVYVPGSLLSQDVAELDRIVRPGCSMPGVRTAYADVRLLPADAAAGPALLATATLAPATLTCAGAATAVSLGGAATTLRIELAHAGAGYLIRAQQVVR